MSGLKDEDKTLAAENDTNMLITYGKKKNDKKENDDKASGKPEKKKLTKKERIKLEKVIERKTKTSRVNTFFYIYSFLMIKNFKKRSKSA